MALGDSEQELQMAASPNEQDLQGRIDTVVVLTKAEIAGNPIFQGSCTYNALKKKKYIGAAVRRCFPSSFKILINLFYLLILKIILYII